MGSVIWSVCVCVCVWIHILPAIQIQEGLVSGLAMLSHVSRSVALSMLGYSCLARSYWQRCHKTGLRGAISGEEETVEKLTRRGPYACPVDCFPQALSAQPSLHCIIHSFAWALSARTSDFLELSVLLFPQNNVVWGWRSVWRNSWWSWRAMSGESASAAAN